MAKELEVEILITASNGCKDAKIILDALSESVTNFIVDELKKVVRFIGSPSGNFH